MKLQDDVIALIGLYPKRIGTVVDNLVSGHRLEVHYLTFYRATRCVGAKAVNLYDDAMRLALKNPPIGQVDLHDHAIDRAHDPQRYSRDAPARVTKNEEQKDDQDNCTSLNDYADVSK
jgi:hypothetical protein